MISEIFYHFGLVGWPLDHSLSPVLHTNFMQAVGITGRYDLYPVPPEQNRQNELKSLFLRFRHKELHGLNITIPYKETVLGFLDNLTPVAREIGAVNTIYLHQNQLVGENTDASGFMADLKRVINDTQWLDKKKPNSVLILGAGGSARAIVYGLSRAGWQVTIAARRLEQAHSLASELSRADLFPLYPIPLTAAALSKQMPDLIVNTTPVGMSPNIEASPWPVELPLPSHASLYDLVYNPPLTKLVRRAQEAGLKATTGLGMLVEQAALAFERWTGFHVSIETKQIVKKLASDQIS